MITATPNPAITLHGLKLSGHVHRVELMLNVLGLPYAFVQAGADVRATEAFRKLNPLGQIPVLQDGELCLSDSTAIMVYLCKRYAPGSAWLPEDALGAAAVQRWLSIASGEVAHGPADARAAALFKKPVDVARAQATAQRLLGFMDSHLESRPFLAAPQPTIADLACYAYVARAPEGGISLAPFGNVRAWLGRIEALPHFVPMPESAP